MKGLDTMLLNNLDSSLSIFEGDVKLFVYEFGKAISEYFSLSLLIELSGIDIDEYTLISTQSATFIVKIGQHDHQVAQVVFSRGHQSYPLYQNHKRLLIFYEIYPIGDMLDTDINVDDLGIKEYRDKVVSDYLNRIEINAVKQMQDAIERFRKESYFYELFFNPKKK